MILKISYNNQNHSSLQFLKNVISSSGPINNDFPGKCHFLFKILKKNNCIFLIADFQDFAKIMISPLGANNAVFYNFQFRLKWSRSILMILRSNEKTILIESFSKKILSHQFKFYYTKSDAFNSFQ